MTFLKKKRKTQKEKTNEPGPTRKRKETFRKTKNGPSPFKRKLASGKRG